MQHIITPHMPYSSGSIFAPSCRLASQQRVERKGTSASASCLPLARFNPELLCMILEQLRDEDYLSLLSLRRVCKRFNACATPIAYRTLELNQSLISEDAQDHYPVVFEHISLYTSHVILSSSLSLVGIKRVLSRVRRLLSVRWRYNHELMRVDGSWLPSQILNHDQMKIDKTKLYIENLPICDFFGERSDAYMKSIPTDYLVSLQLACPLPPLTARLNSLKRLILASPQLKSYHHDDRGQGTSFRFDVGERMPALTDLVLKSYDWNHSRADVEQHWDFSRLEHLKLLSVPVANFLDVVHLPHFASLQTLQVEDYSAHVQDRRLEATRMLQLLVADHVRSLKQLCITCHVRQFSTDAIIKHQNTLLHLSLRDHVGFQEEERKCPTFSIQDLSVLSKALVRIHTLELDMDIGSGDLQQFLQTLSSFECLHSLTLHVQTLVRPSQVAKSGYDPDYDSAKEMLHLLNRLREQSNPAMPWRRITINVGGWRPRMVRRVSTAWKKQNQRGIFAERCFTLQRNAQGDVGIREEMAEE